MSYKHERSLYTFTKNSNDPKANYIKYCKILQKGNVTKEDKKQHTVHIQQNLVTK
jgi:hypothetical protein